MHLYSLTNPLSYMNIYLFICKMGMIILALPATYDGYEAQIIIGKFLEISKILQKIEEIAVTHFLSKKREIPDLIMLFMGLKKGYFWLC